MAHDVITLTNHTPIRSSGGKVHDSIMPTREAGDTRNSCDERETVW